LLYILAGPDDYSLTRSLEDIKRGLGDATVVAHCTTVLDGQNMTADNLMNCCQTIPFLGENRLVLVYGLIERFDAGPRPGRQRTGRPAPPQDAGPFVSCLANLPDTTIAVMIENKQPGPASSFKELYDKAEIREFKLLRGSSLRQWVQNAVGESGATMSPGALDVLIQLTGNNLWAIANEVHKLAAFAHGRSIEEADVKSLVGYSQDASVFAMIDAIVDFRIELASQVLQQLLLQGAAPAFLLFMLDRQFRNIILAQAMKAKGKPDNEIQGRLGIQNDFAFRRTLEQAGRYSYSRLSDIYQQLLEADMATKTGHLDGELAINLLVTELCQRTRDEHEARRPTRTYGVN
jgi:DNA polymerase-3 subunit delta